MSIRIIINRIDRDGKPITSAKVVKQFAKNRLIIGSHENCDLRIEDIPDLGASIFQNQDGRFIVEKNDPKLAVSINGEESITQSSPINNGDILYIGDFRLQFTVEFDRAARSRSAGMLTHASTLAIAFVLVVEIVIVTWLPQQVQTRELWGLEITRERTIELLDALRQRCHAQGNDDRNFLHRDTVRLIQLELDEMASYLRRYVDHLQVDGLMEFQSDLKFLEETLTKLEEQTLYPPRERIDVERYLRAIIKNDVVVDDGK